MKKRSVNQIASDIAGGHHGLIIADAAVDYDTAVNHSKSILAMSTTHGRFRQAIAAAVAAGIRADRRQRVSEKHVRVSDKKEW